MRGGGWGGGEGCSSVGVVLECAAAAAVVVLWVFVRPLPLGKSMSMRSCCHFIYDALAVLCFPRAEGCMGAQLYGKASPSQMSQGALFLCREKELNPEPAVASNNKSALEM